MRFAAIAALALFGAALTGVAAAAVALPWPQSTVSLWKSDAAVAADPAGTAGFEAIRASGAFVPVASFEPPVHATYLRPVVYWFRLPHPQPWAGWFITVPRDIDSADLYAQSGGAYTHQHFGMMVPYAQRAVARTTPTVQLPAQLDRDAPAYLRVVMQQDEEPVRILNAAAILEADAQVRSEVIYPLLISLSVCVALALANLVIFAFVRDRTLLLYSVTMLGAVFLGLSSRPGLGWISVWPHASLSYFWTATAAQFIYYFLLALFSHRFLRLRTTLPAFSWAIFIALGLYVVLDIALGAGVPDSAFGGHRDDILSVTDPLYLGLILLAGIAAWRTGQRTARFFVFASSGLLIGVSGDQLSYVFPVIGDRSILFPFIGAAWEGTMLFAALADNFNELNRDRDRANKERIEAQRAMIEQAQRHSAESEYAAMHDALTGLPNRRNVELELARLAELTPPPAGTYALAYVDLDHFKVVNDTFGHDAGDQLLVGVAEQLRAVTSLDDIVARIGGDEFLVLMRRDSAAGVAEQAERLREAIAFMRFAWEAQTVPLSASVGLAIVGPGASTPVALMSLADAACADAKESGRNRVQTVSDDISATRARRDMDWVTRITRTFEEERFRVYAQSIVPLFESGGGKRIEALIRMLDPAGAVVLPSHFLPPAERYGLMARIDAWVIAQALAACAQDARDGRIDSLSVNLSGSFLRRPDALEVVQRSIEEQRFPADRLCLEITETVAATSLGDLINMIDVLGGRGVRFSLDDFGTGTSSLALLKRLDVDYVKIDGSFVRDCASDPVDAAVIESIVSLARVLGVKTIAEYVVDDATALRVRNLGVDFGQGWAFDQARPVSDVLRAANPAIGDAERRWIAEA